MNIPPPPFPVHHPMGVGNSTDDEGVAAVGAPSGAEDSSSSAYHGYYGLPPSGQNSASGDDTSTAGHPNADGSSQSPMKQQQIEAHQQLGNAYFEHYRTSQTIYDPSGYGPSPQPEPEQSKAASQDQWAGEEEQKYSEHSYYSQSSEQAPYSGPYHHEESFHEEGYGEAPSTPSTSIKERLLPNIFSLAQKLMPTVMNRLDHQERLLHAEYEDYFEGACSPLGSPVKSPTATPASKRSIFAALSPMKSPEPSVNNKGFQSPDGNFKTTGLEESDYAKNNSSHHSYYEDGKAGGSAMVDPEMGKAQEDAMKYLPESAALLVTALQSTAKKSKRIHHDGGESPSLSGSFENLPSLIDEAASKMNERGFTLSAEDFFNTPTKRRSNNMLDIDLKEREADLLLESIRKDDLDSKKKRTSTRDSRRSSEHDTQNDAAIARRPSSASFDDDDNSMVGDMARLSQSIMHLQRDLENVDFSELDGFHDDGFGGVGCLDQYDGENGLLGRLKLWFSRGMIMEQKLLSTYVNPMDNNENDGTATEPTRYSDNPVLVWSLALMWSFVVLILMHPKIAELVEGGDPGQLADIIEWMFG